MFADVVVVVNGALEEEEVFTDQALLQAFLDTIREEAQGHGYRTEVWIRYHDHKLDGECFCAQYDIDHHPDHTYN